MRKDLKTLKKKLSKSKKKKRINKALDADYKV